MGITSHIIFIALIVTAIIMFYLTFFKDLARKHWERKNFIGFMPEDLISYRRLFKAIIAIILISFISMYVLALIGVF